MNSKKSVQDHRHACTAIVQSSIALFTLNPQLGFFNFFHKPLATHTTEAVMVLGFLLLVRLPLQRHVFDCLQQLTSAEAKTVLLLVEGELVVLLHLWQQQMLLCPVVH